MARDDNGGPSKLKGACGPQEGLVEHGAGDYKGACGLQWGPRTLMGPWDRLDPWGPQWGLYVNHKRGPRITRVPMQRSKRGLGTTMGPRDHNEF